MSDSALTDISTNLNNTAALLAYREKYKLLMRQRRLPQEAKDAGFVGTKREWYRFKDSLEKTSDG